MRMHGQHFRILHESRSATALPPAIAIKPIAMASR